MLRAISLFSPLLILMASVFAMEAPSSVVASAAEPEKMTAELQYVPGDTAFFVHADVGKIWNSPVLKSIRAADTKTFDDLAGNSQKLFGVSPDALESATVYWPKLKAPQDTSAFGVLLSFKAAVKKDQLKAGISQLVPKGTKITLLTPSEKTALVLVGLEESAYGKPQPSAGALAATIRDTASGKHTIVAGGTLANLPDEFQRDELPPEVRGIHPLLKSDSVSAFLTLDKNLSVEIRVKSSSPPKAKEAEKSLAFIANMAEQFLGQGLKEISDDKSLEVKDVVAILKAAQGGLKQAKFATNGEVSTATATMSLDLPFVSAYLGAKKKVQEAAVRAQSSNNLKQIVLAFHNYNDVHGSMPPAAVCDKKGKPMLSWRVLILPYVEASDLFQKFKLDEPWDSDNNKKLLDKMPPVYKMATPTNAKGNETHYRALVGNGAAFDYLKGPKLPNDFPDGTSNTLLVVTAKDPVPWTKPDELAFDPDGDMRKLLGFFNNDTCMVGLGDGSVRGISKSISKATLHGAITRNGGEVLSDDF